MSNSAPLQARLSNINSLIEEHQELKRKAPKGAKRRHHARVLRKLHRIRRRLRKDRWKLGGTTAIIKYEVIPILAAAGVPVTSRKRWATFGNPGSDHYKGNKDADAVDGGVSEAHSLADRIKRELTDDPSADARDYEAFYITRSHTGKKVTYRIQIIAGTHGTGPHIHIGCKVA